MLVRCARTALLAMAVVLALGGVPRLNAGPPKVERLQIQKIGDTTYFRVRLQNPSDLAAPAPDNDNQMWLGQSVPRFDPLLMPRLVPQANARAVYLRVRMNELERQLGIQPEQRFEKGACP